MKYCKNCLTTDLRPNAYFDDDGICIVCKFSQEEELVNPTLKLKILQEKIKHKSRLQIQSSQSS